MSLEGEVQRSFVKVGSLKFMMNNWNCLFGFQQMSGCWAAMSRLAISRWEEEPSCFEACFVYGAWLWRLVRIPYCRLAAQQVVIRTLTWTGF